MSTKDLANKYRNLGIKSTWDEECKLCRLPELAHTYERCTRNTGPATMEEWEKVHQTWAEFRTRMKEIMELKEKGEENIDQVERIAMIIGDAMAKASVHAGDIAGRNRTAKLTKQANVPVWPKEMK